MPRTLCELFQNAVVQGGNKAALQEKVNGTWRTVTFAGYGKYVQDTAMGLRALGIQKGDRVAIFSNNCIGWAVSDWGILHLGAVTVPIYDTVTPEKAAYVLNDSGSKVAIVRNQAYLQKLLSVEESLTSVTHFVVIEDLPANQRPKNAITLAELQKMGEDYAKGHPEDFKNGFMAVRPDDLASIVYTSGTTGNQKGVMLSHWNFASNVEAALSLIKMSKDDILLSFLPLSHVFERLGGHFTATTAGCCVAYAESVEKVPQNLLEVRPTVVLSVPRLYEKMYNRILSTVEDGSNAKKAIFQWAHGVGREYAHRKADKKPIPASLQIKYNIANKLVFSKLKERTGGRLKFFVSGGAALAPHLQEFFAAAGLWILQGYGLTETSPVTNLNTFENMRFGSIGKAVPGVEVQIWDETGKPLPRGKEHQGEITVRGPNVMKGYYNLPKETAEVLTPEGWFKTGDIGYMDADGYVFITDRKKELLVMSNGKKVAPQAVENDLKTVGRYVANAVAIGNNRKFIAALLCPNFEELEKWAKAEGITYSSHAELVKNPKVRALYEGEVAKVNAKLSRFEQVKTFAILPRDLLQDQDEISVKMSLKRKVIDAHFKDEIEGLYANANVAE
ncbi:MAG TPA: long-chain fatty acid--CoA ligase [Candidatus Thermoplasmatota archaeon]|nr:long-chain fatty acid--CoA ligase [Candidatus Thermoplasmatota archaeon]